MPIIKWAGSKRQLLPELRARIPHRFGRYIEPFLGSGALFLDLLPNEAILNDFNPELINMYSCIRENADAIYEMLQAYQDDYNALNSQEERDQYYYHQRDIFNQRLKNEQLDVVDASLFIFLNKTCYNGLYRVNTAGLFNTPSGKKRRVSICSRTQLQRCSGRITGNHVCRTPAPHLHGQEDLTSVPWRPICVPASRTRFPAAVQ